MRYLIVAVALSTAGLAGCGTDTSGDGTGGGSDPGGDDDPLIATYSLSWGPLSVPASTESTQCVWMRLSNDSDIKVHQLHNVLGATSHHLIVYKDDMDTVEQRTPVPCQPFTGALNTTGKIFPMMITQKHDDQLDLPHHVAYTLAPHQMIKIEMHYLNAGEAAQDATAKVDLSAADPGAIKDEANILFIGTPDIDLPSNKMTEVHEFFSPGYAGLDLSDAKFFAITGHTHKLGLSVEVNTGSTPISPLTSVYKPATFAWSEPETTAYSPAFTLPVDGGFDFTCRYYNGTSSAVSFGESTQDEMCFFWAYYYPSNGAHVCAHTDYRNLNLNLCCPEAGPDLCDKLVNGGKL